MPHLTNNTLCPSLHRRTEIDIIDHGSEPCSKEMSFKTRPAAIVATHDLTVWGAEADQFGPVYVDADGDLIVTLKYCDPNGVISTDCSLVHQCRAKVRMGERDAYYYKAAELLRTCEIQAIRLACPNRYYLTGAVAAEFSRLHTKVQMYRQVNNVTSPLGSTELKIILGDNTIRYLKLRQIVAHIVVIKSLADEELVKTDPKAVQTMFVIQ